MLDFSTEVPSPTFLMLFDFVKNLINNFIDLLIEFNLERCDRRNKIPLFERSRKALGFAVCRVRWVESVFAESFRYIFFFFFT